MHHDEKEDFFLFACFGEKSTKYTPPPKINGAGISAGAANICVNARARTTPARVCSAPPRSAALGWSLIIGGTFNCSYYLCREPTIIIAMIAISIELWKNNTL